MADDFDRFKEEMLKNPEFKAEYDALEPEYEIIQQLINARNEKNMTQKQLAEKMRERSRSGMRPLLCATLNEPFDSTQIFVSFLSGAPFVA